MKFKDFQAPVLFSSTFKALNLGEKIQVLSRTFKDAWEPCITPQDKTKSNTTKTSMHP